MTESNKQRVVKYWYLQQGVVVDVATMPTIKVEDEYNRLMIYKSRIPVKCAIAEVEASITELIYYDDTSIRVDVLQSDLTELKQLI
jgi:hypothetical protein